MTPVNLATLHSYMSNLYDVHSFPGLITLRFSILRQKQNSRSTEPNSISRELDAEFLLSVTIAESLPWLPVKQISGH